MRVPLSYVIHDMVTIPASSLPLKINEPYSIKYGSVEGELVAHNSHTHPRYTDDNSQVYYFLEEGITSTAYTISIKPF